MSLISAAQLAALRTVAYQGLDTPITIERPTQVETDFGSKEEYAVVASVSGWLREMSTSAAGIANFGTYTTGVFRLHVEVDVDIQPGDHVVVGGDRFTVIDVNNHNTVRVFTTASLRRVE